MSEAPAPIELFIDFLSPYGFLGARLLPEIAARHGRAIDWKPFLLGVTVMKAMGLPPVPATPLKGAYAAHDVPRMFRYYGLTMRRAVPGQIRPLAPNRGFHWVKAHHPELAQAFGLRLGDAAWLEGVDIGEPEEVAALAAGLGMDRGAVLAGIESEEAREALRRTTEEAIARNIFGAPTFVVDGEAFWGHDRLWLVEEWLKRGGW